MCALLKDSLEAMATLFLSSRSVNPWTQFKAEAAAWYETRPGATIMPIAADPSIDAETPRTWIPAAGKATPRPLPRPRRPRGRRRTRPCASRVRELEKERDTLRRTVRELEEERDTLRRAAEYCAGRTRR
ncbi:hypothetical protein [Peterkaempfera sp. SMS 1(5)a]|uniref:hypothetical protein n=1 Tax=Peterkaempfera podocarpi TaxID=3232308 RepID=UPI00366C7DFD